MDNMLRMATGHVAIRPIKPHGHGIVVALAADAIEVWGAEYGPRLLRAGDRIVFPQFSGIEVEVGGEKLFILDEAQVLAVVCDADEGG